MSEPFIGEIRMFAGTFAPQGWAFCEGQVLPIATNQALFSIIGTIYGGDGQTTLGLPDLRGRAPIHQGQGPGLSNYQIGSKGGVETVTLTSAQMPIHSHTLNSSNSGGATANPVGQLSAETSEDTYGTDSPAAMNSGAIASAGGGQSHENRPPYQTVSFIIALTGLFPSQS